MATIAHVIFYSLVGGVFSLAGGFLLLSNTKIAGLLARYATPFAAGALLSAAFIDLLSEAAHAGDIDQALQYTLIGILAFFLLERFLHWFHHHHVHEDKKMDPRVSLIIVGDTIHNFIDGIAIASGFLVNVQTGVVVTLAVAAHEIPQEIGDFGLLLHKGLTRRKVVIVNVLSATATTVAAVAFFLLGNEYTIPIDTVLGMVAGFFIYIAVSDIIPTIHKNEEKVLAGPQTLLLMLGVLTVGVVTTMLHGIIEQEVPTTHSHEQSSHVEDAHHHE